MEAEVIWQPNPGPQTALISCPVFDVFYGGARGGGKTEGSIGDWLEHAQTWPDANGIFLRRTHKQLEEVIARTKELFPKLGAKFREQQSEWMMPNGARLKFRYLEKDTDADEYQGHNYTRVYVEEATNFPDPAPINKMRATLRSAKGVPCGIRLTGNPGGPGHHWVKKRYIDPAPGGYQILEERYFNPILKIWQSIERVFIPSKVSDNPPLMLNDPAYIMRLQQSGSAQLVKAWLDGDWNIIIGAFFDTFRGEKHVVSAAWQAAIPNTALRFRSFDWGSAKPFSVGWYALSDGTWGLPRGALFKYREWYGSSAPNVGLKLDAELVAKGILAREKGELIKYGVADPSIFQRDGGPSIAERMLVAGCSWRRGDNKRKVGWDQLRRFLDGEADIPLLYFSEVCEDTIRTLPILQHDENDAEDVDTDGEDHSGDETRYAVMSRPWLAKRGPGDSPMTVPPDVRTGTMGDITRKHLEKMQAKREDMRI